MNLGVSSGCHPARCPIIHSTYAKLIDRGRRAGLQTRELYSAMASRQPLMGDSHSVRGVVADGNGYLPRYGRNGHIIYSPDGGRQ